MNPAHMAREALWAAMVARVEALHDSVVLGQRTARAASAKHIETASIDLAALARAAALLRKS
ncbi:MAG: hypothetical protein IT547_19105 [Hyphomonadaceae bacterium]|nr:hypothetical protein [Hyphomonadaceae bacterium]